MPEIKCAQPDAPWVQCWVCHKAIKTCESDKPKDPDGPVPDYTCPVHLEGAQLSNKKWVCSCECWEIATEAIEALPTLADPTAAHLCKIGNGE